MTPAQLDALRDRAMEHVPGGPAREPDDEPGERVAAILGRLEPRRAEVLRLRFGLDGAEPRTHREIGRAIGVCTQRAQQIEVETLTALRCEFDPEFRAATRGRGRQRRWA